MRFNISEEITSLEPVVCEESIIKKTRHVEHKDAIEKNLTFIRHVPTS
jgi:hypothetical protein